MFETKWSILRRAERSMVRAMYDVKLVDKRNTEELMDMLLKQGWPRMKWKEQVEGNLRRIGLKMRQIGVRGEV